MSALVRLYILCAGLCLILYGVTGLCSMRKVATTEPVVTREAQTGSEAATLEVFNNPGFDTAIPEQVRVFELGDSQVAALTSCQIVLSCGCAELIAKALRNPSNAEAAIAACPELVGR